MVSLWDAQKRPRDDSDPKNAAWPADTHRRLEVLGNNKIVIFWMSGAWEVNGEEHVIPVRGVVVPSGQELMKMTGVDIFHESNKVADTHAYWLMDNGDSGHGAQWTASDLHDKYKNNIILCCFLMGPEREVDLVRLRGFCGYGMSMIFLRRSPLVVAC